MAPTPYPIKLYHRWGNFFLWGILADIGIVFAAYNKSARRTAWHQNIMAFITINSFLSALAYCYLKPHNYIYTNFQKLNEKKQDHLIWGTTLMVLMIFVSIFGYWVKLQQANIKASKHIVFYKKIHTTFGHFIYILGKYESYLGMDMAYEKESWFFIIQIIYVVVILWRIFLEFILPKIKPTKLVPLNEEKIRMVQYSEIKHDLQDTFWCIFKDQIYKFPADYIHPGGQIIWQHLNNIEIGQFFYGITQLPGTQIQHYHSQDAFKSLFDQYYGTLLNKISWNKEQFELQWELRNKTRITDQVNKFDFQNFKSEFDVDLTHIQPNHFILIPINQKKIPTRLYTFIQCMQKPALEYMEKVNNWYEGKQIDNFGINCRCATLSFYIKNYSDRNGFSQYLTKQEPQYINIEGPFQSLLTDYIEEGQLILICGGTGILPFLDVLNYHLLMTYNQLKSNSSLKQRNEFNLINIPYLNRFITLFYSVTSEEELLGDHIFLKLRELQNDLETQNKSQNFKLILKCRKTIERCETYKERFTRQFVSKYFQDNKKKQIIVCGPSDLRNSVYNDFKEFDEGEIYYL